MKSLGHGLKRKPISHMEEKNHAYAYSSIGGGTGHSVSSEGYPKMSKTMLLAAAAALALTAGNSTAARRTRPSGTAGDGPSSTRC